MFFFPEDAQQMTTIKVICTNTQPTNSGYGYESAASLNVSVYLESAI